MIFVLIAGNASRKVTIEILPADVLVKIFDSYRLDPFIHSPLGGRRPWKWQKLAHVCRTWRSVLLESSHYLGIRLFFTGGMPVKEILSSSPILPIVMRYMGAQGSSPLSLGDQDNIMTLLGLPTRLREVQLIMATPLLEKITTLMQQPFPVLEYLCLSTLHGLVLPSKFGGDMPHLRTLRIVGFALPAAPQLLLSAHDLVCLQLEEVPSVGHTLETLIICLPTMTQLKTLRIHFLSPTSRPVSLPTDQPLPGLSVLPVLNLIGFRGPSEYLESLLTGISAPLLEQFFIDFFDQGVFGTSQLSRFIRRTDMQRSHSRATIHSSGSGISITLTQPGVLHRLSLQILCKQLNRQIRSMTGVCDSISPTLADVVQLEIGAGGAFFVYGQDNIDLIHSGILELFRPFRNIKRLCVTDGSLSLVAGALRLVAEEPSAMVALPELQEIQTKKRADLTLAQSVLAPFIAARRRSTHPVVVCSPPPLRVRFDDDPNMDIPVLSPAPSDSYISLLSPVPLTNLPLPAPIFSFPSAPAPRPRLPVRMPSPLPQAHAAALPYIPGPPAASLAHRVYLNPVLTSPNLQYDMCHHPNQSNLRLSPAVLAEPASRPPLPSLPIRIASLPWDYIVRPDPTTSKLSHGNTVVTVQDVLVALYSYLRKAVDPNEYNAMGKDRKAEIFQSFERRVRHTPDQRGKGLRRVDFLDARDRTTPGLVAQGLVRAQLQNNVWVWNVVID
jgi:hypothetical protein